jgi:putative pyrroloquinoline-quinone binding quinoprotein
MRGPHTTRVSLLSGGILRALLCALVLLTVGSSTVLAKPGHEGDEGSNSAFLARPDGPGGPLVGYDTSTGARRFSLPAGLLTADGQRYFAASASGDETAIAVYVPVFGSLLERFVVDGSWELHGISATGAWLGLRRIPTAAEQAAWKAGDDQQTDIAIMDTVSSRIAHEVHLDGNFDVDGLSRYGDSLYLLQHVDAADAQHYLIRLYDLTTDTLVDGALRDKREPDEEMTGYAWDGTASPNGEWLLTLYLNTKENIAFVHSLNLADQYPVCIDLPSGDGDMAKLKAYTLTMAPDGVHVYAANPVLGRLAVLDLSSWTVGHVASFPAVTPVPTNERSAARSLLSPDGRTLYFTAGQIVWAYDTITGNIAHSYQAPASVAGMGLSPDGTRLLVAGADGKVTAVDLASGKSIALSAA